MGAEIEIDMYVMTANDDNSSYGSAVGEAQAEEEMDLRRGPWTVEEDVILVNYITNHGEGRWNSLARCAGLKRTGKSCRLRWLNYLRPDVRRGNITPEEQLLILELHSRWGNRWSKIAQQLPGRTDNEIKNYWRTRVQKHAKQLKCDVNSQQFKDAMRYLWMPRLMEKIRAASATPSSFSSAPAAASPCIAQTALPEPAQQPAAANLERVELSPDSSSVAGWSSDSSAGTHLLSPPASDVTDCDVAHGGDVGGYGTGDGFFPAVQMACGAGGHSASLLSPCGDFNQGWTEFEQGGWGTGEDFSPENLWIDDDDFWFLQQQLQ